MSLFWVFVIILSALVPFVFLAMGMFGANQFPVRGKTVLITGASTGMGRGVARLLSSKGANVIIVARNVAKLEAAMKYISAAAMNPGFQRFHHMSADVTSPTEAARIIREATAWNDGQPPDIIWANAGAAVPSLFLDASIDTLRAQMDVNYWTAAYLAQHALRAWIYGFSATTPKTQDDYHFIMTSSSASFVGVAGYSPYAPAKAALRSLHDNLRSEISLYNGAAARSKAVGAGSRRSIRIHTVFPGTILTPGFETENITKPQVTKVLEDGDPQSTEDQVAAGSVAKLERGHELITTNLFSDAMRATSMQGSRRDNWVIDTLFAWLMSILWPILAWDLHRKAWDWGYQNGLPDEKM